MTCRQASCTIPAGLPEIDQHDVRHSYAIAGRDAKIDWKALSHRIGNSDVAFTMKQHVQTDLEADRQVANTLAELIIGGSLASTASTAVARLSGCHRWAHDRAQTTSKRPFLCSRKGLWPW